VRLHGPGIGAGIIESCRHLEQPDARGGDRFHRLGIPDTELANTDNQADQEAEAAAPDLHGGADPEEVRRAQPSVGSADR
jgi:hypothetical protein